MGMSINTNLSALNTYRNLNSTQNDLSKSLEKLSTGLRINRAADDASGLTISEGLKSQVGGLTVAARNAQDGISVVQTAEGGLTETHSILQRMRDLAVQAGNDSNNATSRDAIKTEVGQLQKELGRIASSTNFNGNSSTAHQQGRQAAVPGRCERRREQPDRGRPVRRERRERREGALGTERCEVHAGGPDQARDVDHVHVDDEHRGSGRPSPPAPSQPAAAQVARTRTPASTRLR